MKNSPAFGFWKKYPEKFTGGYCYSFQNQEKDDELKGPGNSLNFEFRMHDPRLGRFFAVDPLGKKFPWNSLYSFSENQVIAKIELEGLEAWETKRAWKESDIEGYENFTKNELEKIYQGGEKIDCADLAFTLLIRYASQEGLPLLIHTEASIISNESKEFVPDPNSPERKIEVNKGDVKEFEDLVKNYSGCSALDKNAVSVPYSKKEAGDFHIIKWSDDYLGHTVVIGSDDPGGVIYYGSYSGGEPTTIRKNPVDYVQQNKKSTAAGTANTAISRFKIIQDLHNLRDAKNAAAQSKKELFGSEKSNSSGAAAKGDDLHYK